MNKTILSLGIIFLLVDMSFTSISGIKINNQIVNDSGRGSILYVGGSGEGNYTTIQSAIDNAVDGDTVFVFDDSSPYYEWNILINKSINLVGEDRDTTIIDGKYRWDIITNAFDGVIINGFTIRNAYFNGIDSSQFDSIRIYDNHILNCNNGIAIYNSQYSTITSNTFKNCNNSIESSRNYNLRISNNIINGWSTPQTIFNGEINFFNNEKSVISNNTIINYNEEGYICLFLDEIRDCIIKNNTIKNYGCAIQIVNFCNNNNISNNNIINNSCGVFIQHLSLSNRIINNNFIKNKRDVTIILSPLNYFDGNYWDKWIGVRLPIPIFQNLPKIIFVLFGIGIDWNPAIQPYNYTTTQEYDIV